MATSTVVSAAAVVFVRRVTCGALRASRGPADQGLSSTLPAQLAQLVEHFHGKEGVAGSSPALGFRRRVLTPPPARSPRRAPRTPRGATSAGSARTRGRRRRRPA